MKRFATLTAVALCLALAGTAWAVNDDPADDVVLDITPDGATIEPGQWLTLTATWSGAQSLGFAQWYVNDVPQGTAFNPANAGWDTFDFMSEIEGDYDISFCMWHVTQEGRLVCDTVTVTVLADDDDDDDDEEECVWIGETAWAAGNRYVTKGNWATYTTYAADSTVALLAGQTMHAGTVHFSASDGGLVTITITLDEGWRFRDVPENVKIQDYASAPPAVNPSPGLFAHKGDATGDSFEIDVPANALYGVHVDVEWACCP